MAHTPGPWKVHLEGMDAYIICPDGRRFNVGDIIYHEENKDNARLIAESPNLVEALKPFAALNLTETQESKPDNHPLFALNDSFITVGMVRKARAVLAAVESQ